MAAGLKLQAGAGHPFSTHIALNCNVGTRLRLRVEMHRNKHISNILRFTMPIAARGRDRGLRM